MWYCISRFLKLIGDVVCGIVFRGIFIEDVKCGIAF